MTNQLLTPTQIGGLVSKNRVILAPMTRTRARPDGCPTDLMAEYYGQRASAGLVIAEATGVDSSAIAWMNMPGIYNEEHVDGWKKTTRAVHEKDGKIFLQLWHPGPTPALSAPLKSVGLPTRWSGCRARYQSSVPLCIIIICELRSGSAGITPRPFILDWPMRRKISTRSIPPGNMVKSASSSGGTVRSEGAGLSFFCPIDGEKMAMQEITVSKNFFIIMYKRLASSL